MEITNTILERAADQVKQLLTSHRLSINEAYDAGDEILEIGIKVRLTWVDSKLKIATTSNFVKSRCKDQAVAWFDPDQKQLFDDAN